jgi:acyl carrier protein
MSDVRQVDDVRGALRRFLLEHFPAARSIERLDDAPLLESGIVDSLGILELVQFVTETLGASVGDDDLQPENFGSLDKLAAFVERQRG